MRLSLCVAVGTISVAIAVPARGDDPPDTRLYRMVQRDLAAARIAATIQETTARLLTHPQIRDVAALRKFVTGCAALMSYDRATAERHLAESFRLVPAPNVAAALAANAIESGHAQRVFQWVERGARLPSTDPDPALDVELGLMRAQAVGWTARYGDWRDQTAAALQRARRLGDPRVVALALRSHAQALGSTASEPVRSALIDEAVQLSTAAGDLPAVGYHYLAGATVLDSDPAAKLAALQAAIRISQQIRDRHLEGRAIGARGALLLVLGRYDEARRDLTTADGLLRASGGLRSRATVAGNLALLFIELGDYSRAEEQSQLATQLYRIVGNQFGVRQSLDDLGRLALARGNSTLALARLGQVTAMTRAWGDTVYLRELLVRLGLAHLAHGDVGAAERHVREGLRLIDPGPNPDALARAKIALGDVLRQSGRAAEASGAYQEALAIAPRVMDRHTVLRRANHGVALLEAEAGRWVSALEHYRTAIAEIERGRDAAGQPGLKLTYFAENSALYYDAVETLVAAYRQTGDAALLREALVCAERAKARTLFDAINDVARPTGDAVTAAVAAMGQSLAPRDLLIEFVVGPKRSFVFTLTRDGSITVHPLPARRIVEQQITTFRDLVTRRPSPGSDLDRVRRAGRMAFQTLFASALSARDGDAHRASTMRRLIIVADGLLFYTPFEALTMETSDTYVGEQFEVVRAASAAVLTAVRSRPAASGGASRFVGFADPEFGTGRQPPAGELVRALERDGFSFPQLPGARREIEDAAAALRPADAKLYTGRSFNAAAVLSELQRPNRIVHFATHAILDERIPERSGIVLSRTANHESPSVLRARDLDGLTIPVDLVTLSACQSGLGRVVAGEGVMGLAWAFARAGASSLIVTLWNVSDASSASTMIGFYRALAGGHSKSAALLAARRAIARNPALRHPYFWAGHVLIGDPD